MRELIGQCEICHKDIFCLNGFLNGVHKNNHLYCFECIDTVK